MKLMKNLATLSVLFGVLFAGSAYAVTPANSILNNTAKLTYTGNATGITASVGVTVQLVAAAPTVTGVALPTPVGKAESQAYSETFKLKANGNGPDSYILTTTATPTNLTGSTGSTLLGPGGLTTITIGATALSVESTATTTITVPSDDTAGTEVNGIETGDTVDIGGVEYIVAGVVDGGPGAPSSITLTTPVVASLPVGTGVYEVVVLTAAVANVGTITNTANPASILMNVNVASVANPALAYDLDVTINVVQVTIEKFVRNVTDGAKTTCTDPGPEAVTYLANLYCKKAGGADAALVTAITGEDLEYLVRVTTASGGAITGANLADVLDDFTSYVLLSTRLNNIAVADTGGTPFPLSDAGFVIDDDLGRTGGAIATGAIGASKTVDVIYKVTVN